jgi:mono/diheme cytochrome c family protein
MWGGWYLGEHSADFQGRVYDGPQAFEGTRPVAEAGGEETSVDPMVLGKRTYNNCMACHQADGQGLEGQYPPLEGSRWVQGPPEVFARILLQGLSGEIDVEGETYAGNMPAWNRFDDERIAAVMTYVRNAWSNDASRVSPELVRRVREETKGRREAWSAEELEEIAQTLEADRDATAEAIEEPASS